MFDDEYLDNLTKQYARLFEARSYDEVYKSVSSLYEEKYLAFAKIFYSLDLFREISRHKIKLADIIASVCPVKIIPEDRHRIVFTIAHLANHDLKNLNQSLKEEFGQYFELKDKYTFGHRVVSWREVIQKSTQIRNGYANIAYLSVEADLASMMNLYKLSKEDNPENIENLNKKAVEIVPQAQKYINYPPSTPALKSLMPKIIEFYRLAGRLEIDINDLDNHPDISDAFSFIIITKTINDVKLSLISKHIPINDYDGAKRRLRRILAQNYFDINLVSLGEEMRRKIPLKPIGL